MTLMDVNPLLEKIAADAREAAARILDDARRRAEDISGASEQRIAQRMAQAEERAEVEAADMARRMARMSALEGRKALLADKRGVIDAAFRQALDDLRALPEEEARAYFLRLLVGTAQGGEELLAGDASRHIIHEGFVQQANEALAREGRDGGRLSADSTPGFGFVLRKGGAEVNCTFERLLDAQRLRAETEVAGILFE